jgi:hypothetical protein
LNVARKRGKKQIYGGKVDFRRRIFLFYRKAVSNCFRLKKIEIEPTSWRAASLRANKFWIFAPFATVFSRNQKFYA